MSAANLEFGDWVSVKSSDGAELFKDRLVNIAKTPFGLIYYTARNKDIPLPHGTIVTYVKRDTF